MVHFSGHWRGKPILVVRVLAALLDQQVDGILRDGYLPHRGLCPWPGEYHLPTGVANVLLADGDPLVFCVQVTPEERHQLAFPQSADQLQVEHGQDISGVGGIQAGLPQLLAAETELPYKRVSNCLPIQRVAPLIPLLQPPEYKSEILFSFIEKIFTVKKSPARTESGG